MNPCVRSKYEIRLLENQGIERTFLGTSLRWELFKFDIQFLFCIENETEYHIKQDSLLYEFYQNLCPYVPQQI